MTFKSSPGLILYTASVLLLLQPVLSSVLVLSAENLEEMKEKTHNESFILLIHSTEQDESNFESLDAYFRQENLETNFATLRLDQEDIIKDLGLKKATGIYLLQDQEVFVYHDLKKHEYILNWFKKKKGAIPYSKRHGLRGLVRKEKTLIVGFFQDENTLEAFIFNTVARRVEDYNFYIITDKQIMRDHYQSYGSVMLMKDFDDKETHFRDKFTEENLENFVRKESLPLVIQYEPGSAGKVLNSKSKLHFLLVSNLDDKEHKERIEQVQTVAKNYKDEILFIHVDLAHENLPMLRLLVVTEDVPAMYLYNITDGARYLLTGDVTVENIDTFIQEYKQGNLKRGLVTGELPDPSAPETIKTLALQNLAPAVHQSEKSLFIFMYAPWCEKCKKESETWNSIGEQFKDSKHIQIAKMDIINNELIYFDVLEYPTIAWVPANDTEFRKYYGKRDSETLELYIKEVEKYEEKALRKRLRKELREKMKKAEQVGSKSEFEKDEKPVKNEENEPEVKEEMPEVEVLEPEEKQEVLDLEEEEESEVLDAEDKKQEVLDAEHEAEPEEDPEVLEPEEDPEVLEPEEEDPEVLVVDLPESSSQLRDEF